MSRFVLKKPVAIALLVILVLIAVFGWRKWQGPEVPAYVIREQTLVQSVVASGEVSSQSLARIGSEITGVIKTRHVREGDKVKPGDVLLELNSDELQARVHEAEAALNQLRSSSRLQAQATLREADSNLNQARRERERREALQARQLLSDEQVEQARRSEVTARVARERAQLQTAALAAGGADEQVLLQRLAATRAALAKARVVAQVTGTVQTRNVEPGDLVQPGRTLLEIATDDSREIIVKVDEKNMAPLKPGQSAQIVADAYPGRVLQARVTFIAPAVDADRGTVDVHLGIDTPADFLKQGMTVSATIETGRREKALVLANDALRQITGDRAEVMQVQYGKVKRTPVQLGLRGITQSEIRNGLRAGDTVLIDDMAEGQRVRPLQQIAPAIKQQH